MYIFFALYCQIECIVSQHTHTKRHKETCKYISYFGLMLNDATYAHICVNGNLG